MSEQQMTPEQVEELKEKIKNMSPEELREFQKKQCIFCHIVSGKVQAKKIYEDNICIAVLDINPANPGHMLLMPKEHYTVMPQVPKDILEHVFIIAKKLSNTSLRSLEARGTNIIVANGPAAGQRAQHFMVHIIPRKEKDGVAFSLPQNKLDEARLDSIQKAVASRLGHSPNIKEPSANSKGTVLKTLFKKEEPVQPKAVSRPKEEKNPGQAAMPSTKIDHGESLHIPKGKQRPKKKEKEEKGGVSLDDIADLF